MSEPVGNLRLLLTFVRLREMFLRTFSPMIA